MTGDDRFELPVGVEGVLADCGSEAAAPAAWQLTEEQFRAALARSASQKFSGSLPDKKALENYLGALHLQDLALAAACSAGNAAAWDVFVTQYRPELYRAARAIAGESQGRELADSLYAELFGLRESEGQENRSSTISTAAASWAPGCARFWRNAMSMNSGAQSRTESAGRFSEDRSRRACHERAE